MALPLPRRSLRSLLVLLCVILGPSFVLRRLFFVSDSRDSLHDTVSYFAETSPVVIDGSEHDLPGRGLDDWQTGGSMAHRQAREGTRWSSEMSRGKNNMTQHNYLPNGLVEVNPFGQHPIYELLEKAKQKWDGKLETASRTLNQAVNEYRRRYGRAPPKGFDRW